MPPQKTIATRSVLAACLVLAGGLGLFGGVLSVIQSATLKAAAPSKPTKGCVAYHAGEDGVIRTFCDGKATLHLMLGSAQRTIEGGSCDTFGRVFSLNFGVVAGSSSPTKPDYVGLTVNARGAFTNAVLAIHQGGVGYVFPRNKGMIGAHEGTFEGTGYAVLKGNPPASVKATFTCG